MIRQLKETMEIDRAQMRIRLVLPVKVAKHVMEKLRPSLKTVESEEWEGDLVVVSHFRH